MSCLSLPLLAFLLHLFVGIFVRSTNNHYNLITEDTNLKIHVHTMRIYSDAYPKKFVDMPANS